MSELAGNNWQDTGVRVSDTDQSPDEMSRVSDESLTDDERIDAVAARILERYKPAFEKLAR